MNSDLMQIDETNCSVEAAYVEDGELNVLVSRKVADDEKPGDPEPRWILYADPKTREFKRVEFCIATDEGFEFPPYVPTAEQMSLFENIARDANEQPA